MKGKYSYDSTTEHSDELPEDYGYNESKYIVERTIKDTEHPEKEPNTKYFILIFAITTLGTIVVDVAYLVKNKGKKYSILKKKRLKELEEFEDYQKTVNELTKELDSVLKQRREAKEEVEDKGVIISAALQANPELLEELSDSDKEKIEQAKTLTRGQYKL